MRALNRVQIIGFLGKDVEHKFTRDGGHVSKLSIATDESYRPDGSDKIVEKTEWHRVTFFGKSAENVAEYARKGSRIFVEARLQTSSYEKEGETRYSTDIIGRDFLLLDRKPAEQEKAARR